MSPPRPANHHRVFITISIVLAGAPILISPFSASAATAIIRVGTGLAAVADVNGATWLSKRGFHGGQASIGTSTTIDVGNTVDDPLYQTAVYGMSRWSTTVPINGRYNVTLKMTENYHSTAGARVFHINIEGKRVASSVDIFKAAGRNSAYDLTFQSDVQDGQLDIDFLKQVDKPIVSAISVQKVGFTQESTPAPIPALVTSTDALSPTPTPSPMSAPALTSVGAIPMSDLRYPVPPGSLVVSPWGHDTASGSVEQPLRTVGAAIQKATRGGTIVMRSGRYHETVIVPPGRPLTIQPYPGEHAWFDGSRVVSGWTAEPGAWRVPWTVKFDRSPTYFRGKPDNTAEFWRFVSKEHPLAAYPEMLWLDGVEQKQVGSRADVRPGAFFVDDVRSALVIGTDPTGRVVEASALQTAVSLRAPGTILRGIGVRRYGSAVPDQGVITSYFPSMTIDNVVVEDSGTGGIGMFAEGCTIRGSTIRRSGQVAIQAGHADRLTIDHVLIESANDEVFNSAPAAGGIKLTSSRGITFTNSRIVNTKGHAFWADESVYDMRIVGNDVVGSTGNGIYLEISAKGVVADNYITGTYGDAISLRNTSQIDVWNNTMRSRGRALDISQDYRKASNLAEAGHDTRRPLPDPTTPWIFGDIRVRNNIMEGGGDALILFGVQSFDHEYNASDRNITSNGNVYSWPAANSPRWLIAWSRVGTDPLVFTDLGAFRASQGQEGTGFLRKGSSVFDSAGHIDATIESRSASIAEPLPSGLSALVGRASGTRHLGAWR